MNYFSGIGYASPVAMNPTDFLLDLANGIYSGNSEDDSNTTKQALISTFESNLAYQVKMELQNSMVSFHDESSKHEIFDHYCPYLVGAVSSLLY